jgi:hypothetical protein
MLTKGLIGIYARHGSANKSLLFAQEHYARLGWSADRFCDSEYPSEPTRIAQGPSVVPAWPARSALLISCGETGLVPVAIRTPARGKGGGFLLGVPPLEAPGATGLALAIGFRQREESVNEWKIRIDYRRNRAATRRHAKEGAEPGAAAVRRCGSSAHEALADLLCSWAPALTYM